MSNVDRITNSRGRFIGVHTLTKRYNGQFRRSSAKTVTLFDRNLKREVRLNKSDIQQVTGI